MLAETAYQPARGVTHDWRARVELDGAVRPAAHRRERRLDGLATAKQSVRCDQVVPKTTMAERDAFDHAISECERVVALLEVH